MMREATLKIINAENHLTLQFDVELGGRNAGVLWNFPEDVDYFDEDLVEVFERISAIIEDLVALGHESALKRLDTI